MSTEETFEEVFPENVYPHELSDQDKQKADRELREFRLRALMSQSLGNLMYNGLLRLRLLIFEIIDAGVLPDSSSQVVQMLKEYMRVMQKNQVQLAEDLDLHPTKLSRILNRRDRLPLTICYRLEEHSGGMVSAVYWWKLSQIEVELEILEGSEKKVKEAKRVRNAFVIPEDK